MAGFDLPRVVEDALYVEFEDKICGPSLFILAEQQEVGVLDLPDGFYFNINTDGCQKKEGTRLFITGDDTC